MPFEPTQIFHLWAGTVSCVCKLKRGCLYFETQSTGRRNLKTPLPHITWTWQKERREDSYFMEKLKFQKYFHWYVCSDKDKLHRAWGEGRRMKMYKWWSDQDSHMTSSWLAVCPLGEWEKLFFFHVPHISKHIIIITLFSTIFRSVPEKIILQW